VIINKNKIRKILFSKLDREKIKKFYKIYYILRYPEQMEKKCTFGELNSDIIFYVIRPRRDGVEGLMSLFMNVMKNMYYAFEKGYVPVVDFQNYKTQYADEVRGGNAWEYYFTQPCGYTLDEVYKSKNVILSGLEIHLYDVPLFKRNYSNDKLEKLHKEIFGSIQFNEVVKECVQNEVEYLCMNNFECLGLYLRGTDYVSLKPAGHPIQPTCEQAITVVDEFVQKYQIQKIFLVTEDYNIYRKIKEYYGEKCIVPSFDTYVKNYDGKNYLSKTNSLSELDESPYKRGLYYLIKLIILSQCGYFVGGNTMGAWSACIFSNKEFKDKYIFNLGLYSK